MEHIVGARSSNFDLLADDGRAYRPTRLVSQINTCACRSADNSCGFGVQLLGGWLLDPEVDWR